MQRFKLANVLLESTPQFVTTPTLACRSTAPFCVGDEAGVWTFSGPATHDFTTFFNSLSVAKWKRYTVARGFHLHLELKGAACTVKLTRADSFSWYPEVIEGADVEVAASGEWHDVELDMPASDDDVIEAFEIVTTGEVSLRDGYYWSDVEEGDVRPVELALCTTTFKKESYIEHNISVVRERILASDEPVAGHFRMHVVDNGRTLDAEALSAPGVDVHPNPNVGGAGGFARGMIEAMEQEPKATHVLLMDDDVSVSPESIIRTFNLLSIVNDEYEDAFVSGAMMNMDEPDVRWEDMGFVARGGKFFPLKPWAHMGVLHSVVTNEAYEIPEGVPGYEDQAQHYAAWWYCVVPMTAIEENGLPLPVFVRCDDVEYSLRCHPRFMTMNGICVWHLSFRMRYNAAVERYQMTRNVFIAQATTGMAPLTDFGVDLYHNVQLELKKFNYQNAELALQGFEDYLKGPDFIAAAGMAEESFMAANRNAERLESIEEIKQEAKERGIDLSVVSSLDILRSEPRSKVDAIRDLVTFNGQRLDPSYTEKGSAAVINAAGWEYPAGKIRRKETIVAIDLPNHKGVIRTIDPKRFGEVWGRYKRDVRYYKANGERLRSEYAAARAKLTSVGFWKGYLGLG